MNEINKRQTSHNKSPFILDQQAEVTKGSQLALTNKLSPLILSSRKNYLFDRFHYAQIEITMCGVRSKLTEVQTGFLTAL